MGDMREILFERQKGSGGDGGGGERGGVGIEEMQQDGRCSFTLKSQSCSFVP